MAACVIVDSHVTEPTRYTEYKRLAESTVTLRGRRAEILERTGHRAAWSSGSLKA
jgi:hypothetical protein